MRDNLNYKKYDSHLKNCEYAGEVILDRNELRQLARIYNELNNNDLHLYEPPIILVLAVNCMYYNASSHEFWPFWTELLDETPDNNQYYGEVIESALIHYGFISKRGFGPYNRFVYPIRSQVGVIEREIPSLASLLSKFINLCGLNNVPNITRNEFNDILNQTSLDNKLFEYLEKDDGYYFIQDICQSLALVEKNLLSRVELDSLPGFRDGFFENIYKHIDFGESLEVINDEYFRPHVKYINSRREIALCFDSDLIRSSKFKFHNKIISNSLIFFTKSMFTEKLTGEFLNNNGWGKWTVNGWNPYEHKTGLFDSTVGQFKNPSYGINPGEYICLGSYDLEIPNDMIMFHIGMVNLPLDDLDYDAWFIKVEKESDLEWSGYRISNEDSMHDLLSWGSNVTPFVEGCSSESIFFNELPIVKIEHSELFINGDFACFFDFGSRSGRLDVSSDEVQLINLPLEPFKGRLWVEKIGRRKAYENAIISGELEFIFFPKLNFSWPRGLYSLKDQIVLPINDPEDLYTLSFNANSAIEIEDKRWLLGQYTRKFSGKISTGDMFIEFECPLYRAAIRVDGEYIENICVKNYLQREDKTLTIQGLPKKIGSLESNDGANINELISRIEFNDFGYAQIDITKVIQSRYQQPVPFMQLDLKLMDRYISTGCLVVYADEFISLLNSNNIQGNESWIDILPAALRRSLQDCLALHIKSPISMTYEIEADLPNEIKSEFARWFKFAEMIDQTEILIPQSIHMPEINDSLLDWINDVNEFFNEDSNNSNLAKELAQRYEELNYRLPVQRWQDALAAKYNRLNDASDILPIIKRLGQRIIEDGGEVLSEQNNVLQNELVTCWRHYRRGNYSSVMIPLNRIIKENRCIISDLSFHLIFLCYARLGNISAIHQYRYEFFSKELQNSFNIFIEIFSPNRDRNIDFCERDRQILMHLPFNEKDHFIISKFFDFNNDELFIIADDWLYLFLEVINNESYGNDKLIQKLREVIDEVPRSHLRSKIFEIIER